LQIKDRIQTDINHLIIIILQLIDTYHRKTFLQGSLLLVPDFILK